MYIRLTIAALILGVAGIITALYINRPSAIPADPATLFPDEPKQRAQPAPASKPEPASAAVEAEPAEPEAAASAEPEQPVESPIELQLQPEAPAIPGEVDASERLAETPYLQLTPENRQRAKADVPKLKLFDPEYGTRGFSSRRWVSDRFGIEAGIGYTDDEKISDRDAAAGAGVVVTFD